MYFYYVPSNTMFLTFKHKCEMSYYLLRPTQSECKTMLPNYTKIYTAKRYNYNVKSVYRSTSTDSNILYTQYFCKFWE